MGRQPKWVDWTGHSTGNGSSTRAMVTSATFSLSRITSTMSGGEQGQPQDAGYVGRRDSLTLGQFGDGGELARLHGSDQSTT